LVNQRERSYRLQKKRFKLQSILLWKLAIVT